MARRKIGVDTWAFREMKLKDFVPSLGSLDFDCINLSSVSGACSHVLPEHSTHRLEMLKRICESNGLPISAVQTGLTLASADPDERDNAIDLLRRYLEMCAILATNTIIIDLAGMREKDDVDKVVERTVPALKQAGAIAAGQGVQLAIEADSPAPINTVEVDRRLIEQVDCANVGANYNAGNVAVSGHSPIEAIEALSGRILNAQLKDVTAQDGRLACCPIGEGTMDFGAVMDKLEEAGYAGPVVVEYEGDASPLAGIKTCLENLGSTISRPE